MKSLCYRLHTVRISETMLLKYELSMAKTAHPRSYSSLTNMRSQIRLSSARETLNIAGTLTVLHSRIFAYDPGFLGPRHIYLPCGQSCKLFSSLLLIHNIFSSIHQHKHNFSPFGSFCFWSSNSCHSFRLTLCFTLLAFGFFASTLFYFQSPQSA